MPRIPEPPPRQRGFTLTELLAVVAMAAVLVAVGMPALQEFIQNNNRSTRINTLVTALNFARSDAVTRRRTVRVCPTEDQCACAGDAEFHAGIAVRVETGAADPCDDLVRTFKMETSANFTLLATGPGAPPAPAVQRLDFGPTGRASTNVGGSVAGTTFTYCDDRGVEDARAVQLSATGHPRIISGGLACP